MSIRHANHFQPSALSCVLVAGATVVTFASCGTKNVPSTAITGSAESSSAVSPSSVYSGISRSEPESSQPISSVSSSIAVCATSSQISATNSSKKPSSKPVSRVKHQTSSANLAASKTNSYGLTAEMREGDAYARKQPDVQKFTALLKRAPDEIDWQHDGKQIVLKPGDKAFSEVLSLNAARCTEWLEGLKLEIILNQADSEYNLLLYRYTADGDTVYFLFNRKSGDESSNLGNDVFIEGKDKGTSVYQYYQPDPGPTNRLLAYLNSLPNQ